MCLIVTSNRDTWVDFDPRDNSLFAEGRHHAVFARLRDREMLAVNSNGPVPIYSLVRYRDIERAYKEPELFSPSAGLTLDSFDPAKAKSLGKMLETAAPDRHRALRNAMKGGFRGHALAALSEKTEDLFDRFLADAAGGQAVEFVEAFARGAASMTTSALLGVTAAEAVRLDPALGAIGALDPGASRRSDLPQREKTELWLLRELTRIVRAHRESEHSKGLIESLLKAEVGGKPLSEHEVALNCLNVVLAGTGATQHTLAAAMATWSDRDIGLDAVARDPELGPAFIEETLRWLTPVVHLTRIVTRDTEIRGCGIPQGAAVCLWNISANRDEEVFEGAGAFRADRPPRRHLAFGVGPQHCLGAPVVRAQLSILLQRMLREGVRFELSGRPAWMRSNTITGVESLPLKIRRVDPAGVQTVGAEPAPSASPPRTKGNS